MIADQDRGIERAIERLHRADWHNQHVKLDTTDILEQIGLDWIPGHFNIDTYAEDFTMLSSIQNIDLSTLQPYDNPTGGEKRWISCSARPRPRSRRSCGCGSSMP